MNRTLLSPTLNWKSLFKQKRFPKAYRKTADVRESCRIRVLTGFSCSCKLGVKFWPDFFFNF